jgi:hypothetical protein
MDRRAIVNRRMAMLYLSPAPGSGGGWDAPDPVISFLRALNRRQASASRPSMNLIASSLDIGPDVIGREFGPMVSSTK